MHNIRLVAIHLILLTLSWRLILSDIRHRRLPDRLNAVFFLAACALPAQPAGTLACLFALLILPLLLLSLAGYRRNRILIGLGDVKLLGGMSVWLGELVLPVLLLASVTAGLVMAAGRLRAKADAGGIGFAPFLLCYAWLGIILKGCCLL